MLRIATISLFVLVSATLAIRYPIKNIPERIDANGQKWVGPIRLCPLGVTDQELNACAAENIELVKPSLSQGFLLLKKFDYDLKFGPVEVKLTLKDIKVKEVSEFLNLALTFNTTNNEVKFAVDVRDIVVNAIYKVGGTAVSVPIRGSGPAIVKLGRMKWTGSFPLTVVTRTDRVDVIQLKETVTNEFKFEGLRVSVKGLFSKTPSLSEAFHNFVNNYGAQIFDVLMRDQLIPAIGKVVTEEIVNPFIYNAPQLASYLQ